MATYGYARVSTDGGDHDLQLNALAKYGVDQHNIFQDTVSGAVAHDLRTRLPQLLTQLQPNHRIVVWKLDRLGKSAIDMLKIDELLKSRQVSLISITEGIDTSTSSETFYYSILAALAQMERATIIERINAGLDAAKLRGKRLGRPRKLRADVIRQIQIFRNAGESIEQIVSNIGVSRATVYRALSAIRPNIAGLPDDLDS